MYFMKRAVSMEPCMDSRDARCTVHILHIQHCYILSKEPSILSKEPYILHQHRKTLPGKWMFKSDLCLFKRALYSVKRAVSMES